MKVILSAVAFLALLPAAQSAPEDKTIVFLSLKQAPSQWLSDKPIDLHVDPFGKSFEQSSHTWSGLIKKAPSVQRPTWPLLDAPGPGYRRMTGELLESAN